MIYIRPEAPAFDGVVNFRTGEGMPCNDDGWLYFESQKTMMQWRVPKNGNRGEMRMVQPGMRPRPWATSVRTIGSFMDVNTRVMYDKSLQIPKPDDA